LDRTSVHNAILILSLS